MQTTQPIQGRCPVYIHPSACNPSAITEIQHRFDLYIAAATNGRAKAVRQLSRRSTARPPFGGDAA